jgi:hypothetical protein
MSNILNEVISKNFAPMKPWSARSKTKGGNHYNIVKKIRHLLKLLSGDMLVEMLRDVLTNEEKLFLSDKLKKAVENNAANFSQVKPKDRHRFVKPLREAGLLYKDVRHFGYKVSTKLWKSCLNDEERNKGGRHGISDSMKTSINNYLESCSHVASNR